MLYPRHAAPRLEREGRHLQAPHESAALRRWPWRAALRRGLAYFLLWMVIAGGRSADLAPGLAAAAMATWASLRLMPPDASGSRVRWPAALGLLAHFAKVSVLAGFDVARRALMPRMRLDPGLVLYRPRLPPSDARSLFQAITSQMPGTIPSGTVPPDTIAYHCLDSSQQVAQQLAVEESRLLDALGGSLGSAGTVAAQTRGDA
jgi:multicomponent Na+:H+ antiporter subunit E